MKQKTRIASKLFAALVVLTLISCCFLGTTMARYTSAGTGTAKVQVAKWDIDFTGPATGEATLKFGDLSPDYETTYNPESPTNATNSTGRQLVAIIDNKSEVAAKVTLKLGDIDVVMGSDSQFATDPNDAITPMQKYVEAVFSIKFYNSDTDSATDIEYELKNGEYTLTLEPDTSTNTQMAIYAEVTWTTYYDNTDSNSSAIDNNWKGVNADKLDTWIGEHISYVSWDLSYTAVQASELP